MSDEHLDLSRRDALRNLGITLTLTTAGAGVVSAQDAAHVHHPVTQEKTAGPYQPKCFNPHEYATLRRLSELIMPAGEPEFIDLLASRNDELAHIYTGGLAWLDQEIERRHGSTFLAAAPEQQTAMLDLIAYRKNESPELGPGIRFFAWVRNMVVDAYFTSKIGMDYLGFMGNGAMSHFSVPQAAIDYALKRSPLA